ncbi:MAG: hypothetical protein GYB31_07365 [Bacteroidetes bacterium]|nr:hypothetical protein [Bacteroidota bacterium]
MVIASDSFFGLNLEASTSPAR